MPGVLARPRVQLVCVQHADLRRCGAAAHCCCSGEAAQLLRWRRGPSCSVALLAGAARPPRLPRPPPLPRSSPCCARPPGNPPRYLEDACVGDSGGPLFLPGDSGTAASEDVVYGIVSYGKDCNTAAPKNKPGVYTSTAVMRPWIDNSIDCLVSGTCTATSECGGGRAGGRPHAAGLTLLPPRRVACPAPSARPRPLLPPPLLALLLVQWSTTWCASALTACSLCPRAWSRASCCRSSTPRSTACAARWRRAAAR